MALSRPASSGWSLAFEVPAIGADSRGSFDGFVGSNVLVDFNAPLFVIHFLDALVFSLTRVAPTMESCTLYFPDLCFAVASVGNFFK